MSSSSSRICAISEGAAFSAASRAASARGFYVREEFLAVYRAAYAEIMAAAQALRPIPHIAGVLVQPMIPQGPVLKYSKDKKGKEVLMEDPRVPALRQWFSLTAPDGDTNYDKTLSDFHLFVFLQRATAATTPTSGRSAASTRAV